MTLMDPHVPKSRDPSRMYSPINLKPGDTIVVPEGKLAFERSGTKPSKIDGTVCRFAYRLKIDGESVTFVRAGEKNVVEGFVLLVPEELKPEQVLTVEWVHGIRVGKRCACAVPAESRD